MKYRCSVVICLLFLFGRALCQDTTAVDSKNNWEIDPGINFYFIPDDFFVLPIITADKGKLHLEARYNYEDRETFSLWTGYNFNGGRKLTYSITPMVGGVVGNSNGIAPGLRFELALHRFTLSSESEYFLDLDENVNNFYYNWSDLTYSIRDWIWLGGSIQRTRAFSSSLDVQYGLVAGGSYKRWELNTYIYNIGDVETFLMVAISVSF